MSGPAPKPTSQSVTVLRVTIGSTPEDRRVFRFEKSFRIGRADDCDVCIKNDAVSRHHAEVLLQQGRWWIRDLQSMNGLVVADQHVKAAPVGEGLRVRLGLEGPVVDLQIETTASPEAPQRRTDITDYERHYFGKRQDDVPVGEHTMIIRQVYQNLATKQKRRNRV